MGHAHFQTRTLERVSAEISLNVPAYIMKHLITIFDEDDNHCRTGLYFTNFVYALKSDKSNKKGLSMSSKPSIYLVAVPTRYEKIKLLILNVNHWSRG